jgi:2-(1,2-epoxy-1,2-dihydrophenyl)acetyl-CoA isomerase
MIADLTWAFEGFANDDAVRAILITGEGRGFCSGANLSGRSEAIQEPPPFGANDSLIRHYNPFCSLLRRSPKPTVSAVNGAAAGIGASIALLCDLIVAGESGYFIQAFRRVGLVPDGGATYLLSRLVGKTRAMELMLLGEKLSAEKALEWGVVNRCVPDAELLPTALALADALSDGPASLGFSRNLIWAGMESAWSAQLEAEAYGQAEAQRTTDAREGVLAFAEKRPPQFKGK